jgi:hypothetical protein
MMLGHDQRTDAALLSVPYSPARLDSPRTPNTQGLAIVDVGMTAAEV